MNIKKSQYDVAGIGSALLDFMVEVDYDFIDRLGLAKGGMSLIDEERSLEIMNILRNMNITVTPGGSCANTIAGLAKLGGKGLFIGHVAGDDYGRIYIDKTVQSGVSSFITQGTGITGHAITFITPDSERTFATHLGAAVSLGHTGVDFSSIIESSILHLEGYLFEAENLRDLCYRAMEIASGNGVMISVDLSDPGLIQRIPEVMKDVVKRYANIVFANEEEAETFTGHPAEDALDIISRISDLVIIKLGEKGSLIKADKKIVRIDAVKTDVVNTNGAGDMYAAGILYGLTSGRGIEEAGRIASHAASRAVSSRGARVDGIIDISRFI